MARYSAFLGRRVEVQYRAGEILLPASGTSVADLFGLECARVSRLAPLRRLLLNPATGLIGLGLMGRPMGMNLLKAGYTVTVWNRTASRADELVAAGAKLAKSPQEAAAAADFLITL